LIPKWTGDAVKKMHLNGITIKALAAYMGLSRPYLNGLLNGRIITPNARLRVLNAIDEYIKEGKGETAETESE
jgi:plasmid maintenance system antidote protein VapI